MKIKAVVPSLPLLLLALFLDSAFAQESGWNEMNGTCATPVYRAAEVSRKAIIISKPEPTFTEEARTNNVQGRVVLSAVLCSNGRVTNVQIVKRLPYGLTGAAIEAARQIKFTPAERDGRTVSQRMTFLYDFNTDDSNGCSEIKEGHVGQLVESVDIQGNRRTLDKDILYYIGTRPGEPFDIAQIRRDLQNLRDLRLFDKRATCVSVADGVRGGVDVVFTIQELPIIRDLQFTGLSGVAESDVLRALRENRVGIAKESVYDTDKIDNARRVITHLLAARGWPKTTVEVRVESLSATAVSLIFVINQQQ